MHIEHFHAESGRLYYDTRADTSWVGPERYAQYQHRRKAWLAPAGEDTLEVVP